MNIEGLDYNTRREQLVLPEYGRGVQSMVDHAKTLPTKEERQRCAESIVAIMGKMFPYSSEGGDHKRKLWDHLAIMSRFELDIDYPCDISSAKSMAVKPQSLGYPQGDIPVRHYGKLIFDTIARLKTMPAGDERDELIRLTANQMKRNLVLWGHGSNTDERVASDLARFTDGEVQLDLSTFRFEPVNVYAYGPPVGKEKKKRR